MKEDIASFGSLLERARSLTDDLRELQPPPEEVSPSKTSSIVYLALVKNTRDYIVKLAYQINGSYENSWYDACAVMIRRLIETLIIEVYEAHDISEKIKNENKDFYYLGDLILFIQSEPSWNLSRNAKNALSKLKDIGDKSAHSRRFIAHRQDIDKISTDLRVVIQELLYLSKLK